MKGKQGKTIEDEGGSERGKLSVKGRKRERSSVRQ